MTALLLYASTFVLVLALGLQSRFVNHSQPKMAFLNSFLISGGQLILYKLSPDASGLELWGYMMGGPCGIVCSIWIHNKFFNRRK
jgi:hypothetical protein